MNKHLLVFALAWALSWHVRVPLKNSWLIGTTLRPSERSLPLSNALQPRFAGLCGPLQRIAVFDNDGTLCCESPVPLQAAFALDEVKRLARIDPALNADPIVSAAVKGDIGKLMEGQHHDGLMRVIALTHVGMTTDEFQSRARQWLATAKDPKFGKPYTDLTYQPMLELLQYLRANEFKTFIVSGGGTDFIRVWSEETYGIAPENVVCTSSQVKFQMRAGQPVLIKTLNHLFIDDKEASQLAFINS